MEESKRKELEEKLRKMLITEQEAEQRIEQMKNRPSGARVIRRRKGLPDLAVA